MLFDEEAGELSVSASRGLSDSDLRLSLNKDLVKILHSTAEPFFVDNPPDPVLQRFLEEHREEVVGLHSHIWVPLRIKSGFLGIISVSKKFKDQEYEPVDLELLRIIAQQLSIAVYNFRLISNLPQRGQLSAQSQDPGVGDSL